QVNTFEELIDEMSIIFPKNQDFYVVIKTSKEITISNDANDLKSNVPCDAKDNCEGKSEDVSAAADKKREMFTLKFHKNVNRWYYHIYHLIKHHQIEIDNHQFHEKLDKLYQELLPAPSMYGITWLCHHGIIQNVQLISVDGHPVRVCANMNDE